MAAVEGDGLLGYRLLQIEERQRDTDKWRREVDEERNKQATEFEYLRRDMNTLSSAVDSLRRVILGFAMTIAGSAVVFALSVLIATGKL